MSSDTCWNEYEDYYSNVPYAIILVAKGFGGERLYFIHPYRSPEKVNFAPIRPLTKKERNIPILHVFAYLLFIITHSYFLEHNNARMST